jgi:hypothetical protein
VDRGRVFGLSELAGRKRGLQTTLKLAIFEKPNARPLDSPQNDEGQNDVKAMEAQKSRI